MVSLDGGFVMRALIDSHAHPADACLTEFDHPIPTMESIRDVLDYIAARAPGRFRSANGSWFGRCSSPDSRNSAPNPRRVGSDSPEHPVLFATGPDASLNSLALKQSAIGRDFQVTDGGSGFAEKDSVTGEPTGILRNCTRFVKVESRQREPSAGEKADRLVELFRDYNAVGITGVCERDASVWRRSNATAN